MFRAFSHLLLTGSPDTRTRRLFLLHPLDLTALLELAWDRRLERARDVGAALFTEAISTASKTRD